MRFTMMNILTRVPDIIDKVFKYSTISTVLAITSFGSIVALLIITM